MKNFLARWFIASMACGIVMALIVGGVATIYIVFDTLYNLYFTPATITILGLITAPILVGLLMAIIWKDDINVEIEAILKEED